jgi:uncharacterized protein
MKTDATYLGSVVGVTGAKVLVEISPVLPSTSPIVHGRVYRLGQIGSFVRIPLGFLHVYGIVAMVGATDGGEPPGDLPHARTRRTLEVQLIGEAMGGGSFQRGVSQYPTLDDEVHVVTEDDLSVIYGADEVSAPIAIGTHASSESLSAVIDLDRLVTRHGAVVGSTGSGKSNTVAALLRALAHDTYPSANVVVIDPHGEYGAAFDGISRVFRIGDTTNPLVVPYWALSFDELAWFLVDRRSASETNQDSKLRDLIFDARKRSVPNADGNGTVELLSADEITADSPLPFDLRGLWYTLDREERLTWSDNARSKEALEQEGNPLTLTPAVFRPAGAGAALPHKNQPLPPMGAYATRILNRLKDKRFDFMLNLGDYDGVTKDLHDLVGTWIGHDQGITVLDLAGIPSEITDLVVGLIARTLFETMFWGRDLPGMGRQRPLLMVFEEAHSYLPRADGQFIHGYARRTVQRILKEGRKYGVGALVVSQRPSELDETVLSQCGTFFALRLTNSGDQACVSAAVPDEVAGLTNLLPALRTGEALVLGEALPIPSRVRIKLVSPRPDSGDPEVARHWSLERESAVDFSTAINGWRRQRKPAPPQTTPAGN